MGNKGNGGFQFDAEVISSMKYFQYRIIASHMFKWQNLPPGLTSEKLELMLIDRGTVGFFNTKQGFYILPYSSSGTMNVYGDLTNIFPVTANGEPLTPVDTLPRILWDNSVRQDFDRYLRAFSERLADIQKSINIVEEKLRTPSVVAVDEFTKEYITSFMSKVRDGNPVVAVNKNVDIREAISTLDLGVRPEFLSVLWNDYNKVEGEIYCLLGTMFNVEQNKAAGVGQAETVVNYAQTYAIANSRLQQRQDWCNRLNAEFGNGIWCDKAHDIEDIIAEMMNSTAREPEDTAQSASEIEKEEDSPDDE